MTHAMHGDGIGPDDFADPFPAHLPTLILITLTPRTDSVDDLEVQHSPDLTGPEVVDTLACVVEVLRAAGPGVVCESGVIFGGLERG